MSNLLTRLYRNVITNKPYFGKPNLLVKYARGVLFEQGSDFTTDTVSQGTWDILEQKYYLYTTRGTQLSRKSSSSEEEDAGVKDIKGHRGETSTIITLLKKYEPEIHQLLIKLDGQGRKEEFFDIIQRYTSKDSTAYDVQLPSINRKYEVKEIVYSYTRKGEFSGGNVQVGAHGKGPAANLTRNLKEIIKIVELYKKIPTPEKFLPPELNKSMSMLASDTPLTSNKRAKPPLRNIESGEISKGLVEFLRMGVAQNIENFLKSKGQDTTEPLSNTAQAVKAIYSDYLASRRPGLEVKDADARAIDTKAKEIIDKEFKKNPVEAFTDACENSIFRTVAEFDENYSNYFNYYTDPAEQTQQSKELLKKLFPETGLFVVDEKGWVYAGYNYLDYIVQPDVITAASVKVKRVYGA